MIVKAQSVKNWLLLLGIIVAILLLSLQPLKSQEKTETAIPVSPTVQTDRNVKTQ